MCRLTWCSFSQLELSLKVGEFDLQILKKKRKIKKNKQKKNKKNKNKKKNNNNILIKLKYKFILWKLKHVGQLQIHVAGNQSCSCYVH